MHLNILLGIVPRTTSVGCRYGYLLHVDSMRWISNGPKKKRIRIFEALGSYSFDNELQQYNVVSIKSMIYLDSRNKRASQNTWKGLHTKEYANDEWGEHDQGTRWNHLLNRGIGGDLEKGGIVWLGSSLHQTWDSVKLPADFLHHLERRTTHTLHCHGREPVRQHGTNNQTNENFGSQNINSWNRCTADKGTNRAKETRAADPMANPWKQKQEGSMVYNSDQVSSHF